MEENTFSLNGKKYSNNNDILLELINILNPIMINLKDNSQIKELAKIIDKINYIIEENKKNWESIRNDLSLINPKFDILYFSKQEIKFDDGSKYIGPILNGLPHGKGTWYSTNGDIYEGDFKNGKKEGKGIYFYGRSPFAGDRYEGDYKNNKQDGKGIIYFNNGDIYQGDLKNGKMEGKGILYWSDGGRAMGDYSAGRPIGKHAVLTKDGNITVVNHH